MEQETRISANQHAQLKVEKHPFKRLVSASLLAACISAVSALAFSSITYAAPLKADDIFNPHPEKDDVIVPMPCQGYMVFKRVYTSNDSKLNDKSFKAGSGETSSPISQSLNTRYIQGSFHNKNGYYYLIGKYEVNKAQYDILKNFNSGKGKCVSKPFNIKDKLAVSNITWFDAMEAANQYSLFLSKIGNKMPELVYVDKKTIAFARLPMDSEWEFAARGGNVVSSSEFSADVFPFAKDKTIADYAWYKGQDSAGDGKVRVIGLKEPNPLGLYDILGNVNEMMFDPFYATRTGRLHGQSGGLIVRGGSVLSSKEEISTSYRGERAFYTRAGANKSNDMGMRLVLSFPFTTDFKQVRELNKELAALGKDNDKDDIKGGGNLNTVERIDQLLTEQKKNEAVLRKQLKESEDKFAKENESLSKQIAESESKYKKELAQREKQIAESESKYKEELAQSESKYKEQIAQSESKYKEQLEENEERYQKEKTITDAQIKMLTEGISQIRQDIIEANTRRDEMRNRAIISNLRLGGYLCSQLAAQQIIVEQNMKNENLVRRLPILSCRKDPESEECKTATEQQEEKLKRNRELADQALDFFASYYADHIVDTVDTFDYKFIALQEENAKEALGKSNRSSLGDYISLFVKDLKDFNKGSRNLKENKARWIKQCRALKDEITKK